MNDKQVYENYLKIHEKARSDSSALAISLLDRRVIGLLTQQMDFIVHWECMKLNRFGAEIFVAIYVTPFKERFSHAYDCSVAISLLSVEIQRIQDNVNLINAMGATFAYPAEPPVLKPSQELQGGTTIRGG
jgi:hypothetical protein